MKRSLEILAKLESSGIDPKQARAILECLELAAAESQRRAHPPALRSAFSPRGMQSLFHRGPSASAISPPSSFAREVRSILHRAVLGGSAASALRKVRSILHRAVLGGSAASALRIDLIELKTSLIGWMFFFAVTQSLATALLIKILLP